MSSITDESLSRRRFLKVMGASAALAGLGACSKLPPEKIIPYVTQPDDLTPGNPSRFATAMELGGVARGILATSEEGRPVKLEGNPRHPSTRGKSDLFLQAELLQLYDPDRAKAVSYLGAPSTWDELTRAVETESERWRSDQGESLRILSGRTSSPTLLAERARLLKRYPRARWYVHEPASAEAELSRATRLVFGQALRPSYDLSQARVIVSLDADLLGPGPAQIEYAEQFTRGRRRVSQKGEGAELFNRLYAIETSLSLTGANADHRWPVRPSELPSRASALGRAIGLDGPDTALGAWAAPIARELLANPGRALVIAGEHLPAEIQAVAFLANERLRAPVVYRELAEELPLHGLASELAMGRVGTLLILGGNPAYDAPASLGFREHLLKAALRIRLGLYHDETSELCQWSLPESHFLESWGDARALDGSATLQQPLIQPLHDTRSTVELLSILAADPGRTSKQALEAQWGARLPEQLRDGFVPGAAPTVAARSRLRSLPETPPPSESRDFLEAVFRPDATVWDGRYANNAWLQELPKPILQLTWDNAILCSPETLEALGLADEDEVELKTEQGAIRGAVLGVPGHAADALTLTLGYGRTRAGRVGDGLGYDAYRIRNHENPWTALVALRKTGARYPLATTHSHHSMEGRALAISATLADFISNPKSVIKSELKETPLSLLPPSGGGGGEAWAMAIDLTACIGCATCTLACQAENNIPVVGKEQVRNSREMHWIRIDRYLNSSEGPGISFHPVPCMHCEKAPCEVVCPTAATNHSHDGLNQMVYNRCVGTRYCSNNCPYKVRRFNFLNYSESPPPGAQSGGNGPKPRRDGEVHLLHPADPGRAHRRRARESAAPRRRDRHRVPAGLPHERDRFRRSESRRLRGFPPGSETAELPLARGARGAPANDLPGRASQPEAAGMSEAYGQATDQIAGLVTDRPLKLGWLAAFLLAFAALTLFLIAITYLLVRGVGIWGINIPVAWGFAITNFVWWVGIGHAGTFISAILLLLHQEWRTSINRFAEAMTLFAVACAGMMPLLHLGRPWFFYWLLPYPDTMDLWPQFRSPLVWDVFAVSTYLTSRSCSGTSASFPMSPR